MTSDHGGSYHESFAVSARLETKQVPGTACRLAEARLAAAFEQGLWERKQNHKDHVEQQNNFSSRKFRVQTVAPFPFFTTG